MIAFFKHAASGIDAEAEWNASRERNVEGWAGLVTRLVSAIDDPSSTAGDSISGDPTLRFFKCRGEAMVYVCGLPSRVRVLIVGRVRRRSDEGALTDNAQRRSKLR